MASLFLLPFILAAISLAPGFAIVRRCRLSPLETFVASIGASLVLIYLATFAIFLSGANTHWHWITTAIGAAMTLYFARDLRRLLAHRSVRPAAIGLLVILAWTFLLTCSIRHYSGGNWSWDWFEHYQRAQFFLGQYPADYMFIEMYPLPARPPMMNILAAHAIAHTSVPFETYQLTFTYLNALLFLPCCLFLRRWRRGGTALLTAAFLLSPVFIENALFPWTKLLCGFYSLLALHFYLRGLQKHSPRNFTIAFTSFAAALLVHYSAGPWVLLVTLHYLLRVLPKQPNPARRLITSAALPALLLFTWIGWSAHAYGLHTTVASNTAVTDSEKIGMAGNLHKIGTNLYRTLLPHPAYVSNAYFRAALKQPSTLGLFRDYFFFLYQPNYILSMGSIGGLLVLLLLWRDLGPRSPPTFHRNFWRFFIPTLAILGVAVHGSMAFWGAAHICLTPLSLLGVTYLIANLHRLPAWLRIAAVIGWALDFVLGVLFQIIAQSRVFTIIRISSTHDHVIKDAYSLSDISIDQYDLKIAQPFAFLGDYFANYQTALLIATILFAAVAIILLARGAAANTARSSNKTKQHSPA